MRISGLFINKQDPAKQIGNLTFSLEKFNSHIPPTRRTSEERKNKNLNPGPVWSVTQAIYFGFTSMKRYILMGHFGQENPMPTSGQVIIWKPDFILKLRSLSPQEVTPLAITI